MGSGVTINGDDTDDDLKAAVRDLIRRRKDELGVPELTELDRRAGLPEGRFSAILRKDNPGAIRVHEVLGIARALHYDLVRFIEFTSGRNRDPRSLEAKEKSPPKQISVASLGWRCPECRRVWAPSQIECLPCNSSSPHR